MFKYHDIKNFVVGDDNEYTKNKIEIYKFIIFNLHLFKLHNLIDNNNTGKTIMHILVENRELSLIKYLVKTNCHSPKKYDFCNLKTNCQVSPLMLACLKEERVEIIEILIPYSNLKDVDSNLYNCISYIIEFFSDVNKIDYLFSKILERISKQSLLELILHNTKNGIGIMLFNYNPRQFMNHNVDSYLYFLNILRKLNLNIYDYLDDFIFRSNIFMFNEHEYTKFKIIFKKDIDFDKTDLLGNTQLINTVIKICEDNYMYNNTEKNLKNLSFLTNYIDINAQNYNGQTALHYSILNKKLFKPYTDKVIDDSDCTNHENIYKKISYI